MAATGEPREALIARLQALYLDGGIDGVALVAHGSDACPACLAVTDMVYLPTHLPPLPIEGCARPGGCRCRYEPSVTVYE
jgi:hypothetical protein